MKANFQKKMNDLSIFLNNQRHLKSIKEAFMMTVPITMVGSIALLISTPPIPATTENATLQAIKAWCMSITGFKLPYTMTIGIFGLWVLLTVAYCHAKNCGVNVLSGTLIAAVSFMCISVRPEEGKIAINGLGSGSIFAAMVIGLVTIEMYAWLLKKNVKIKMPEVVPPAVSAPLEAMLSCGIIIIVVVFVNEMLISLTGMNFSAATMAVFRPLVHGSDTLVALIFIVLLQRVLWFFGIHGSSVTNAVLNPILMANLVANQEAYAAGLPIPHTLTTVVMGGSFWGLSFLPAAIVMVAFCKSAHLKSLGKIGIIPAFCGIGEPINFGTPFILNFDLLIPSMVQFVLNCSVAYICMDLGIIHRAIVNPTLGLPSIVNVCMASMDWKAGILWVILLAVDVAMYIPFMRSYDQKLLKEEEEYAEKSE